MSIIIEPSRDSLSLGTARGPWKYPELRRGLFCAAVPSIQGATGSSRVNRVIDVSPYRNDFVTAQGTPFWRADARLGLVFDNILSSTGHAITQRAAPPQFGPTGTTSIWANFADFARAGGPMAFSMRSGGQPNRVYIQGTQDPGAQISFGIGNLGTNTVQAAQANRWYHLLLAWNNGNADFYVDGERVGGVTYNNFTLTNTYNYGSLATSANIFNGLLGPCYCWSRALSAAEVRQVYLDDLAPIRPAPLYIPTAAPVGDITLTPDAAQLTLDVPAVTVEAPITVAPAAAQLTLDVPAVTVDAPTIVQPDAAQLTLDVPSVTVELPGGPITVVPDAAQLTLDVPAVTVEAPITVAPDAAQLTLDVPPVEIGRAITPAAAQLTLDVPAVTLVTAQFVTPTDTQLTLAVPNVSVIVAGFTPTPSLQYTANRQRLDFTSERKPLDYTGGEN